MTEASNKKSTALKKEQIKEILRASLSVSDEENKTDKRTALYQALRTQQSQK